VRSTGEVFELIENIKNIPIYPDAGAEVENIEFPEKYKIFAERAGRKIVTDMKNSARP
jgi:hypothetical protein